MLAPWKKSYNPPRHHIKKQRHHFTDKDPSSQSCGFSSSHVWVWELDYKESWALKNWCFWTVVLEKTLESPLGSKEIEPVNSNGNQSWIFIGRTDAEAEAPILWPPWCKELTHFKRPWCWERLKMEGEGDNRGGDGWMESPTRWTWVWINSRNWWWTGRHVHGVAKSRTQLSDWIELMQERMSRIIMSSTAGNVIMDCYELWNVCQWPLKWVKKMRPHLKTVIEISIAMIYWHVIIFIVIYFITFSKVSPASGHIHTHTHTHTHISKFLIVEFIK